MSLATVSSGFSIVGMTAIFAGAFVPVVCMGIALELGKLSAVAWLAHHYEMVSRKLKAALMILAGILMVLNAIGAYGFIAKAHTGHVAEGEVTTLSRNADVEARLSVQASVVADLDRRIAQIGAAIEKATTAGRAGTAMRIAEDQRKVRAELAGQRIRDAHALSALKVEKAQADGDRRKVEADLGPVRYLATLLGSDDEHTMQWFILIVALLLDPAAVVLLIAAARR